MNTKNIVVKGARVHNLKNVDIEIPRNKLVVITGLSGSGKSSLAFDTIYAEGQRRYMESLSSYARQFMGVIDKPDVDLVEGLSPTIAINQRSFSSNPRSTVGTLTEIYHYLRVIYAAVGKPHCPKCNHEITKLTVPQIIDNVIKHTKKEPYYVIVPLIKNQRGEHKYVFKEMAANKYTTARVDGNLVSIQEALDIKLDKNHQHSIDVRFNEIIGPETPLVKIQEIIKKAIDLGDGFISLMNLNEDREVFLSQLYTCMQCGISLPKIEPRSFSFNSPLGACPRCMGLGTRLVVDPYLALPNKKLSISEGAIRPWTKIFANKIGNFKALEKIAEKHKFSLDDPVEKLNEAHINLVLNGEGDFEGVIPNLERKYKETDSDYVRKEIEKYMRILICPECTGKRLREEMLKVTLGGLSIADLVNYDIIDLQKIINSLLNKKIDKSLTTEKLSEKELKIVYQGLSHVLTRLNYLEKVGLGYLTLNRSITTLSGGELQRVRLAVQLGSQLVGIIYVLDEPSIGLHQRDNAKLIKTLKGLRDQGNSVIVVEHDEIMIREADFIIDIGPGAGNNGGEIIAQGTIQQIMKVKKSLTSQYLAGNLAIKAPSKYRPGNNKFLTIKGAKANNLKNIDVTLPLGKLVCISGVSGSGKSTLVSEILVKALSVHFYKSKEFPAEHDSIEGLDNIDKVINIDQSPIGRTPRSNPATYTGVFTYIRDLFLNIPEARMKGYKAGHFSFNVKGGRCEACQGEGMIKIDMQFLQDVYIPCEECDGRRYKKEALEVYYKGKNIADILDMTINEARRFFGNIQIIYEKLNTLYEVGLGYLTLGQSATTLSGGEAQRIKLATELSRRATGSTLYILDEPTTGLHFEDIQRLLTILNRLVDKGNTVLIIEHNLDVIKCADWVIDLGPDGGDRGGELVAFGTPHDIAKAKNSYTGDFLKKIL